MTLIIPKMNGPYYRAEHYLSRLDDGEKKVLYNGIIFISLSYENNNDMKIDVSKELRSLQRGRKRTEQISQGMYDGRFRNKVVPDKKKQQSRDMCRSKVSFI
jgi:hypothetical protein